MTRDRVLAILEGEDPAWGRSVAFGLNALIVLSAIAIALETVPWFYERFAGAFLAFEILAITVFASEYVLRVWVMRPWYKYVFSVGGLIDLISFLPSLLLLGSDWRAVRILRLLRLFRLFKLLRYTRAIDRMGEAVERVKTELAIFSMLTVGVLYLAAVGIYHFEHDAQPEAFGSIPESMWWAVATLTTVGYGDVYPVTPGGRAFTGFILFIGLGIVAVPTGLIASALTREEKD
jgi:voltage-gated potassium channel